MNKIRDFKNIADDIMKDIEVDEDLKERTLQKCQKNNNMLINKVLIATACFLLILGIANIYHIISLKNQESENGNSESNLMLSVDDSGLPQESRRIIY